MIVARVDFGMRPEGLALEKFADLAEVYVVTMLRSWQIQYDYNLCRQGDRLLAYVLLPMSTSFDSKHASSWTKESLKELCAQGMSVPIWEILDTDSNQELSKWEDCGSLVLFTHFLDKHSPVVVIEETQPVAICALPLSDELRDRLYRWCCSYRELDSIWMGCSPSLAPHAYLQLANPNSELSVEGRAICQGIEEATGKPTFYFLLKYWASPEESRALFHSDIGLDVLIRPCPVCKQDWRRRMLHGFLPQLPNSGKNSFYDFAFRCEGCRLVSNEATRSGKKRQWRHGDGSAESNLESSNSGGSPNHD